MFYRILDILDKPYKDDLFNYLIKNDRFNKAREWFGFSFFILFIINIISISFIIKFFNYEPPVVMQVNSETLQNKTYDKPLIVLDKPRVTLNSLATWGYNTINKIYYFDFNNYDQKIKDIEKYFLPGAYISFLRNLEKNNIEASVKDKKQIISLVISDKPNVLGGVSGGTNVFGERFWQISMKGFLTATSGTTNIREVSVEMMVIEKIRNNQSGFYISELQIN